MQRLPVGIIGYGYWGPNLVRTFTTCPLTEVVAVCDARPDRLERLQRTYPHVRAVRTLEEFLDLPLQAAVVATPVATHFPLASRCLEAGLHVFVEKPLAASVREAQRLVAPAISHATNSGQGVC